MNRGGPGEVKFEWLMPHPPETREQALQIRDKAQKIPFLNGTLVSENGKALCLYLPITSKDISYRVYSELKKKITEFGGSEHFYITGLPVAQDTFGVEMFKQMAVSAPVAMIIIFLIMLFFFRKLVLIISPMVVAIVSVIFTMGLLVVTGNTVHIMSSMIPIFIMPIAVLDAVHILSDFYDRFAETKDSRKTVLSVMKTLFHAYAVYIPYNNRGICFSCINSYPAGSDIWSVYCLWCPCRMAADCYFCSCIYHAYPLRQTEEFRCTA